VEIVAYFANETLCLSLERGFFVRAGQRQSNHFSCVICTHVVERVCIRVFLLGYLRASANEHDQSGFKVSTLLGLNHTSSGLFLQTSMAWVG